MQIILDVSEYQSTAQLDALLRNGPDEIVGVYIKATQDLDYRDSLADAFAAVCVAHRTLFGYYDFVTNAQMNAQAVAFADFVKSLKHAPTLRPMTDAEGAYVKWAAGIENWARTFGSDPALYAQLSNMPKYVGLRLPKWVAQYDSMTYYRPSEDEVAAYKQQGFIAWQWTSNYNGLNQDASVLLGDISALKMENA